MAEDKDIQTTAGPGEGTSPTPAQADADGELGKRMDKTADDKGNAEAADKAKADDVPALTARQIRIAKQAGLSDRQIARLTVEDMPDVEETAAKLQHERTKAGIERRRLERVEEELEELKSAKSQPKPEDTPDEDDLTDETDWPTAVKKVNALRKQIADLKAERETDKTQREAEAQRAAQREEDSFFAGLDPELFPEFGTGKTKNLEDGSPEAHERNRVIRKAKSIKHDADEAGDELTLAEARAEAMEEIAPDKWKQYKARMDGKARKGGSARPSGTATQQRGTGNLSVDDADAEIEGFYARARRAG